MQEMVAYEPIRSASLPCYGYGYAMLVDLSPITPHDYLRMMG